MAERLIHVNGSGFAPSRSATRFGVTASGSTPLVGKNG